MSMNRWTNVSLRLLIEKNESTNVWWLRNILNIVEISQMNKLLYHIRFKQQETWTHTNYNCYNQQNYGTIEEEDEKNFYIKFLLLVVFSCIVLLSI